MASWNVKTACTGKTEGEENRGGSGDAQAQRALPGRIRGSPTYPEFQAAGAPDPVLMLRGSACWSAWSLCRLVLYLSDCTEKHFCGTRAEGLSRPGCCNQPPHTGWLMKKKKKKKQPNSSPTSRGGCRSEMRVAQGPVMVLFRVEDLCLYPRVAGGAVWPLGWEHESHSGELCLYEPPPEASLPNTVTLGIRSPSCDSRGTQPVTPQHGPSTGLKEDRGT